MFGLTQFLNQTSGLEAIQALTDLTIHRIVAAVHPTARVTLLTPHLSVELWIAYSERLPPTALNWFFNVLLETPPWMDGIVATKSLIPILTSPLLVTRFSRLTAFEMAWFWNDSRYLLHNSGSPDEKYDNSGWGCK
jgi:hypothetical protein